MEKQKVKKLEFTHNNTSYSGWFFPVEGKYEIYEPLFENGTDSGFSFMWRVEGKTAEEAEANAKRKLEIR